jgi:hypothetical protein
MSRTVTPAWWGTSFGGASDGLIVFSVRKLSFEFHEGSLVLCHSLMFG